MHRLSARFLPFPAFVPGLLVLAALGSVAILVPVDQVLFLLRAPVRVFLGEDCSHAGRINDRGSRVFSPWSR